MKDWKISDEPSFDGKGKEIFEALSPDCKHFRPGKLCKHPNNKNRINDDYPDCHYINCPLLEKTK